MFLQRSPYESLQVCQGDDGVQSRNHTLLPEMTDTLAYNSNQSSHSANQIASIISIHFMGDEA